MTDALHNPTTTRARLAALLLAGLTLLGAAGPAAAAVQVQDLGRLKGAESSKLVGMGLVVGLPGTGDGGDFAPAMRPLAAMMQRLVDPNVIAAELEDVDNVAIVSLTAKLPSTGIREGDTVDIQVASVGAADSLRDGRLFLTPLYGPVPGSPVFAFGEGRVVIEDEASETVGVIKNGATLTRDIFAQFLDEAGRITFVLDEHNATWPMANTLATLINDVMAPETTGIARAIDPKNIVVQVPARERTNPAPFISQILEIQLDPTLVRTEARVVINQRTETIVMTGDVEISPVVISHKGLTITTITPPRRPTPDQPQVTDEPFVGLDPAGQGGARLADLLAAFNQLKVPAADRIAILKELNRTGKLHARLVLED